jgi:hypothetical protein
MTRTERQELKTRHLARAKQRANNEARQASVDCGLRLYAICQNHGLDFDSLIDRHTGNGQYVTTGIDAYTGKHQYTWEPNHNVGVGVKHQSASVKVATGTIYTSKCRHKPSKQHKSKIQNLARDISAPDKPWCDYREQADILAYIEAYQDILALRYQYNRETYHDCIRPMLNTLKKRILTSDTVIAREWMQSCIR